MPMRPIYHGPVSTNVKRVKQFSAATLGITSTLAPLVMWIDVATKVSEVGKTSLMVFAVALSGSMTALVNWVMKSYVTRILVDHRASKLHHYSPFVMETLNFLGQPTHTFVESHQIQLKKSILSTWQTPSRKFFVQSSLLEQDPMGKQILNLISEEKKA